MKIKVTHVDAPWKASESADPLYTIYIEGQGSPQKTYDSSLATVGEHEAEYFTSKSGKQYWRSPRPPKTFQKRSYGKSPEEQAAIMRMNALTNAVAFCAADCTTDYVLEVAQDFYEWLNKNQTSTQPTLDPAIREKLVENGLRSVQKQLEEVWPIENDLPPIEAYEGMGE